MAEPSGEGPGITFEAIVREESLPARVAIQLERLIVENHLQPGDRLPSERELARQFNVSRTVIREAVRALAAKDLLDVQAGSGTSVRSPSIKSVSQSMRILLQVGRHQQSYTKLQEVRRLLELEIAGLAAQRRTDADLAALERLVAEAETLRSDRDAFAANDVAFHYALACATQNELFPLFLDSIAEFLFSVRLVGFGVDDMPSRAQHHHRAILAQVRAGDSALAREAMHAHMVEAEATLRKALAAENGELTVPD